MAKSDIFLRLKSLKGGLVKGESADDLHKEEIDLRSLTWGMRAATAMGAEGAASKTSFENLQFTKEVDRASTAMMGVLRSNDQVVEAVITVRKAGGATALDYFQIKIKNGRLTSYDLVGDSMQPEKLLEHFHLSFKSIEVQYKIQDDRGGSAGATSFVAESI